MIFEGIIGETAEIIAGRLVGRVGVVVAFDGEYATLQSRSRRMTVHLDDLDIDEYLSKAEEQADSQNSVCSISDWYDPYAEKT